MKVLLLFCTLTFVCFNTQFNHSAYGDPYPEDSYPYDVVDASFSQKIIPPETALPIDDYLIALAAARDANFIADVTSIPKEEIIQPFPATPKAKYYHWEPKFYLAIRDMTQQHGMSLSLYDPSTFLFWKEPNVIHLASQFAKEADTDPKKQLPDAIDLYGIISEGKELLANVPKEGKNVDIPLSDLPQEQRENALQAIRQLFISKESFFYMRPFGVDWDTATLHLKSLMWNSIPVLSLAITGSYHQLVHETNIDGFQMPDRSVAKSAPVN